MKKLMTAFAILGLVVCGGQAVAEIGTIDDVPAATLLLPYFEVDLNNPDGVNTLFSVNNASAAPAIAHVTLWTDLSIETIDFDIYLTGYDVQTINLRDVFAKGNLPRTAHPSADTEGGVVDVLSPSPPEGPAQATFWDAGDASPALSTGGCDLPFDDLDGEGQVLRRSIIQHIQAAHSGSASPLSNSCYGLPYDDGVVRGYVTVDSTSTCTIRFPLDEDYWLQDGEGIGNNRNILWGDYFLVDPANNFAQGENLVHIEADSTLGPGGEYTFYGRYDEVDLGADNREPLATSFATRYLADFGPFDGTDLLVWRDSKSGNTDQGLDGPFTCGTHEDSLSWYPLDQTEVAAFDEEERLTQLCGDPEEEPISGIPRPGETFCFPAETQRVPVNGSHPFADPLDVPYNFGWLFLNLNQPGPEGALFGDISQNWVSTLMSAGGRFSVGLNAIQLDNAGDYPNFDGSNTPSIADPETGN